MFQKEFSKRFFFPKSNDFSLNSGCYVQACRKKLLQKSKTKTYVFYFFKEKVLSFQLHFLVLKLNTILQKNKDYLLAKCYQKIRSIYHLQF